MAKRTHGQFIEHLIKEKQNSIATHQSVIDELQNDVNILEDLKAQVTNGDVTETIKIQ